MSKEYYIDNWPKFGLTMASAGSAVTSLMIASNLTDKLPKQQKMMAQAGIGLFGLGSVMIYSARGAIESKKARTTTLMVGTASAVAGVVVLGVLTRKLNKPLLTDSAWVTGTAIASIASGIIANRL